MIGFVPRGASAAGSYHFIGVQVAHAEVFRDLPAGEPASSVGGVYDALIAARPGAIRGFVSDATFWDIGTSPTTRAPPPNRASEQFERPS